MDLYILQLSINHPCHIISDRHRGQLEEWLVLNHLNARINISFPIQEDSKKPTLYKQPAWNRFLHVLHGFVGRDRSTTCKILGGSINIFIAKGMVYVRIADGTFNLALEVKIYGFLKQCQTIHYPSILRMI